MGPLVAGIRREQADAEKAVSSSCGGPERAVAGLQKKRGPKTAGVAGRRVRAPGCHLPFACPNLNNNPLNV